ncbi:dof zinc finger protein 5 [Brachypodium distachyon]|uniref:Dof-type domain-containing protein n=1 Tax=Brachypodium distachyon TaxID=15368 RepID=I1HHN4_BRADI|nr:dof zinc finger protein 5 [Brachypodium distachyon]PNT70923.1 hypothetical protein BRADI_2g19930v3 [Brachypodium distachyon]|eukprot:XP_003566046.2 dof zinc finger protein 5 [Brachypodium distachyon]
MVEMGGGAAAAGFKLFGKVITRQQQQQPPTRASPDSSSSGGGRGSVEQLEEAARRARAAAGARPLPCPRCRSEDTKFCYFNNYNVNQPRHFCRACHRYWTAGGAIRNVPVGSGRRKNRPVLPHADYQVRLAPGPASASASVEAPDMAPALGFIPAPEHGWSSLYVVPSPSPAAAAYRGHGAEMEQCWWLVHAERPPLGSSDPAF